MKLEELQKLWKELSNKCPLKMDIKEIKEGWAHFLNCLDLGRNPLLERSPLDAEAIRFMNEFSIWLNEQK